MQERKLVFGALIETEDLPIAIGSIISAGRLIGMEFSVGAADLLRISAGTCLLPDGVIIIEDESKSLLINNSSFPAEYTVIYQLEDTRVLGGSPALLRLLPGILRQSAFTDSTVIGWLRYPGGSVPLSKEHLIQPKPIRVEHKTATLFQSFVPPFVGALRPPQERPGSAVSRSVRVASLTSNFSQVQSFGGVPARVLSAAILSDSTTIPADNTNLNYATYVLRKAFVTTGNTSTGSPVLAAVANVAQVSLGQSITGVGVPSGSVVTGISGSNVTMSGLATANGTGTSLSFIETLFSHDTRTTQQGAITAGVPKAMVKTSGLAPSKFIIEPTSTLRVESSVTGTPVAGSVPGEVAVVLELPAASGVWQETGELLTGENTTKLQNVSSLPAFYNWRLPFVISGEGQPYKVISRLAVDFNCLVTFKVFVDNQLLTLDPVAGTVASTGGLVTREFSIPTLDTVTWTPGKTGYIDVTLQAQTGGSASFAHISLSLDNSPYLLFI